MKQRILFALSSHGYGHVGQTAPVIRALQRRKPGIEIVVRSGAPPFKLREKFGENIRIQRAVLDIGMIQQDALNIDFEETARAYAAFHQQWDVLIAAEKQELSTVSPDLIVANIPYLTLAAAHELAIPAIAFCSLNWAELYQYFFKERPESGQIFQQMLAAYNQAECFLQPAPAMEMPGLCNPVPIGPVAQIGQDNGAQIRARLGIGPDVNIVLVSLGGMELEIDCDRWPRFSGIHFLVPEAWGSSHPDTTAIECLGFTFSDLMCSTDVLIAKPGYGSFVEAACTGKPVLFLPRKQWPEVPILVNWLGVRGIGLEITRDQLQFGDLESPVLMAASKGGQERVIPSGVNAAVDMICQYL